MSITHHMRNDDPSGEIRRAERGAQFIPGAASAYAASMVKECTAYTLYRARMREQRVQRCRAREFEDYTAVVEPCGAAGKEKGQIAKPGPSHGARSSGPLPVPRKQGSSDRTLLQSQNRPFPWCLKYLPGGLGGGERPQ
jgi:hypothetical protein